MKAILRNDLYNLRMLAKNYIFVLLFVCGINLLNNNASFAVSFTGIYSTAIVSTSFSFDESTKWTRYAMAMPLKRSDYPKAKFLLLFLLSVVSIGASTLLSLLVMLLGHSLTAVVVKELLFTMLVILGICWAVGSIDTLLLLKYGAEKARILFLIVIIAAGAFAVIAIRASWGISEDAVKVLALFPLFGLAVAALCLMQGIKVFEKKEL